LDSRFLNLFNTFLLMKKHNFSAGPAILPRSVIEQTSKAVLNFNNTGLSIMEMSHRGKDLVEVLDSAMQNCKDLLGLDDRFEVLFLTGGASSQFYMSAMNLLDQNGKISLIDTGTWSSKAYKEIKKFGPCEVIASSKDKNYNYIPKNISIPSDTSYLHMTSNNTIFGTQFHQLPETDAPIISDMSSDIFSRAIDVDRYGLIYCGAQKNMGPAGATLVIIRKDLIGKVERDLPTMLSYQTHVDKKSAYNTWPVLPIYVSMLTMQWVKDNGGTSAMNKRNQEKAQLLYHELDNNPLFKGVVEKEDRSLMNITFQLNDDSLSDAFLKVAAEAGCSGLKGHRSVGGFRASTYNALEKESVQVLVDIMKDFAQKHG